MATSDSQIGAEKITEGLFSVNLWNPFDFHIVSYVKSPIQLHFIGSKTALIGRALRHAVIDLLDHLSAPTEHVENETTIIGTEYRLCHSRRYMMKPTDAHEDRMELEITSMAPSVFYQLREDIGIPNTAFEQSFKKHHLKDFTNPGKSGSLMYKTSDDLFIVKTLREYEARLLMQILSGYHLQFSKRSTILNRYVGLYSIRFPTILSSTEIYLVVMVSAFSPVLNIDEVFDLKGSTIKRKLVEHLSTETLHKLKDLDFSELYPRGIRIPSNLYHRLEMVCTNDAKVLKKLNITDFSLILGVRHLDMATCDLTQRRPVTGVAALLNMSHTLLSATTSVARTSTAAGSTCTPYLKPLEMLDERINTNLYYKDDAVAFASLPIPGIVNGTNKRVYLYLAIVDMLQTYDSFKLIEQTLKKITDPNRSNQYSVIEPEEYAKRFLKFLFGSVFVDAGDDFPWAITDLSKPVLEMSRQSVEHHSAVKMKHHPRHQAHSIDPDSLESSEALEFRL